MLLRLVVIFINVLVAVSVLVNGWKGKGFPKKGGVYFINPQRWGDRPGTELPCIAVSMPTKSEYLVAVMGEGGESTPDSVPTKEFFAEGTKFITRDGDEVDINRYRIFTKGHIVQVLPTTFQMSDKGLLVVPKDRDSNGNDNNRMQKLESLITSLRTTPLTTPLTRERRLTQSGGIRKPRLRGADLYRPKYKSLAVDPKDTRGGRQPPDVS